MGNYLDWLLREAYARGKRADNLANWFTVGLVIGALLVYFF